MIEEDSLLVGRVKNDNDECALQELVSRHSGIYNDMIRRFASSGLNDNDIVDIINDKEYQIYKAALEFDETKCKFSTYIALKTKYLCLTKRTNNKKNKETVNFDDVEYTQESSDYTPSESAEKQELLNRIFNLIEGHKDHRVRQIFKERYFSNTNGKLRSWKDIAHKLDLSIQGCINIHNKTLKELKFKISNEKNYLQRSN